MAIPRLLVGILLLTLGRKLYWLFVGAIGFAFGLGLATRYLSDQPGWALLVIALGVGLLGAILAVFVQRVAISVAGFIGGGFVAVNLLGMLGMATGPLPWLPFVVGGILGVLLVSVLFDWALIALSSLTGASLIVDAAQLRPLFAAVLFLALLIAGIVVQASLLGRD